MALKSKSTKSRRRIFVDFDFDAGVDEPLVVSMLLLQEQAVAMTSVPSNDCHWSTVSSYRRRASVSQYGGALQLDVACTRLTSAKASSKSPRRPD